MRTRALKLILAAAALLRLGLLAAAWDRPEGLFTPDSGHYVALSRSLADDGAFRRDGRAEIFRTPGYPLFLTFAVPFGRSWWRAAAAVQIALDVLAVYLTFLLGRTLFSRRVGLWAAGLQAVNPLSIAASVRVLSDSLFAVLLVFAVLLLVRHFRSSRFRTALAAAAVLAAACYVRPVGIVPLVLALALLGVRAVRQVRLRRAEAAAAGRAFLAATAIALGVLAPWAMRNLLTAGYAGFSSVVEVNTFGYEAPAVLARAEGITPVAAAERLDRELRRRAGRPLDELTPGELAGVRGAVGGRVVLAHPGTWAMVHARTSLAALLPGVTDVLEVLGVTTPRRGTLAVLHSRGVSAAVRHYFAGAPWAFWLCAPAVVLLVGKYLFAVVGAAGCARAGAGGWMILLLAAALIFAGGPAATPRFRVPVAAFVSLVAAAGWVRMLEDRATRRKTT